MQNPPIESGTNDSRSVDLTRLLQDMQAGNRESESRLYQSVYRELKLIARRRLRSERKDLTIQPTALVGEAYEKLVQPQAKTWQNRAHFMAVASKVMRQIVIDYIRRKKSAKRGGGQIHESVSGAEPALPSNLEDALAVHEALEQLAVFDERLAQVVEMTFFGGMTQDQVAESLGLNVRTIKRDWELAQKWLKTRLAPVAVRSAAAP